MVVYHGECFPVHCRKQPGCGIHSIGLGLLTLWGLRLPGTFTDPSEARSRRCTSVSPKLSTSDSPVVHQVGKEYANYRVPARIVGCQYSTVDLACPPLKRTAISRPASLWEARRR